jgi:hypothetical protein
MVLYTHINSLGLNNIYTWVMEKNTGKFNPYHNNFHLENIAEIILTHLPFSNETIEFRTKIITAALFHDFDHSGGKLKNDDENIALALNGYYFYCQSHNIEIDNDVIGLIECTRYPYKSDGSDLSEMQKILRDADILQGMFCQNYINGVIRALAEESGFSFEKMLEGQETFLTNVKFLTKWASSKAEWYLPNVLRQVCDAKKIYKIN